MNIFPLIVNIEATNGRGEDNHVIAPERVDVAQTVVIGVFDGLGGRSAGYDELRGGRIASAIASERTREFLGKCGGNLNEDLVIQLQEDICKTLKKDADAKIKPSRIRGSLAGKRLCTTVAIASIHKQDEGCEVNLAWMGDSRIYFLSTEKGLQQLTSDDLETKKDAFEMIHEDPPMSKYLTADIPLEWRMNFNSDKFESSGCILACTDGCFQYMPSPWDFEKLLLSSLNSSNTIKEWENLLHQEYEEIKQDDVSLILYSVGFSDFETLKQSYQERLTYLKNNFDSKNSSYDDLKEIWKKYRCNYEEKIKLSKITATSKEGAINIGDRLSEPSQINQVDNKNDSSLSRSQGTTEKYQKINELLGHAFHASNPQEAIQVYKEVIKLEPEHVKANFNIGKRYAELGSFAKAIDYFLDVINKNDEKFTLMALLELGIVYRKIGNNEEFVKCFKDAFKHPVPEHVVKESEMEMFAKGLEEKGELDQAVKICNQIIQRNSSNAYAHYLIGHIKHKQGQLVDAQTYLDRSVFYYRIQYRDESQNQSAELAQREYHEIWRKINNKSNY